MQSDGSIINRRRAVSLSLSLAASLPSSHPTVSCICPGLPFGIFQYQIRVIVVLGSLVWYWKMQFGIEHEFGIDNSYISYEDSTREEDWIGSPF